MLHWLLEQRCYRALAALGPLLTAFAVASIGGKWIIAWLGTKGLREQTEKTPIEDERLREQINVKSGTPTMGGLILLAAVLPSSLLWGDLGDPYLWTVIATFVALALVGMVDDWMKLTGKEHGARGLKVRHKLMVQAAIGCALGLWLWSQGYRQVHLGYMSGLVVPLGAFAIAWVALVVATMSNAVNVTDGLDGLAGGLSIVALLLLGETAFLQANAQGVSVFTASLTGALLGFLWHNWHPARVFMGDTGALAIGGSIGLVAVMARVELLLPLIAFVFLVEFGSTVLQVLWFKATGERILPIAPIHYIWQKKGVPETHIVARFLVVGIVVGMCALLFL